jgi:hypothetical protein
VEEGLCGGAPRRRKRSGGRRRLVAMEAQGSSVLLLDGGEGTSDRGGDGEVAEAVGATVPR